jgi:hypothetical protein
MPLGSYGWVEAGEGGRFLTSATLVARSPICRWRPVIAIVRASEAKVRTTMVGMPDDGTTTMSVGALEEATADVLSTEPDISDTRLLEPDMLTT